MIHLQLPKTTKRFMASHEDSHKATLDPLFRWTGLLLVMILCQTIPAKTADGIQGSKKEDLRVWRDIQRNETNARFIRYRGGIVYLESGLRRTIRIAPQRLSIKDRKYVSNLLREKKKDQLADEFDRLAAAGGGAGNKNKSGANRTKKWDPFEHEQPIGGMGVPGNQRGPGERLSQYTPENVSKDDDKSPSVRDKNRKSLDPFEEVEFDDPVENKTTIDPFEEMPAEPNSFGGSTTETSPAEAGSDSGTGYQPPTIANKLDDSATSTEQDLIPVAREGESESNQTTLLIMLGFVAILLLVTIGILLMIFTKSRTTPVRRPRF